MAERSGFFDAHLVNGEYDRVYLAENFAKYFASFIGNGVFGGKSGELMVQQRTATDMSVKVLAGQAFIDGYWYENDSELSLAIDIADGVLNRIDVIVVRWNNSERVIRLAIKKGTPAANASAPFIERSADFYELKLAEVHVKAGATRITQADIVDTRLDEEVCGFVVGVVQQLDTQEFGKQLGAFVEQFMKDNQTWFIQYKTSSNNAVNTLLTESQAKVDKLVADGQTSVNNLITTKTTEINKLISDNKAKFDASIAELEEIKEDNDLTALYQRVTGLRTDVDELSALFVESGPHPGCYYRIIDGENEWINPPNEFGIAYRTTERWNNKPVYQKLFYVGALPNKTLMGVAVNAHYTKIISVSGFAIDNENLMHYPFPIIQNGLAPIAVIQGVESDGGDESLVVIQTNEDISHMTGYITVKYTKE